MKLLPLGNKFTFTFVDKVVVRTDDNKRRTQFEETTESGFTISSYDESTKTPRWGVVVDTGPDVSEFEQGDKVLIDALQWSDALEFDGENIWYSDVSQVLAVEE